MKVRLLSGAKDDLLAGYAFYESIEVDVGAHFLASVYADIATLRRHGGIHTTYGERHYFKPCGRFPFAIYYRVESDTVLVDAVLDCRRDPKWIQRRLTRY